jgi:hypothetical protein
MDLEPNLDPDSVQSAYDRNISLTAHFALLDGYFVRFYRIVPN